MKHVQRFLNNTERYEMSGVNISQFSFTKPKPGANLHKRPFKKDGKVWKIVTNDDKSQYSQPAITAGPPSSCLPPVCPQPLAVMDPTGKKVPKKTKTKVSKKSRRLSSSQ